MWFIINLSQHLTNKGCIKDWVYAVKGIVYFSLLLDQILCAKHKHQNFTLDIKSYKCKNIFG